MCVCVCACARVCVCMCACACVCVCVYMPTDQGEQIGSTEEEPTGKPERRRGSGDVSRCECDHMPVGGQRLRDEAQQQQQQHQQQQQRTTTEYKNSAQLFSQINKIRVRRASSPRSLVASEPRSRVAS